MQIWCLLSDLSYYGIVGRRTIQQFMTSYTVGGMIAMNVPYHAAYFTAIQDLSIPGQQWWITNSRLGQLQLTFNDKDLGVVACLKDLYAAHLSNYRIYHRSLPEAKYGVLQLCTVSYKSYLATNYYESKRCVLAFLVQSAEKLPFTKFSQIRSDLTLLAKWTLALAT